MTVQSTGHGFQPQPQQSDILSSNSTPIKQPRQAIRQAGAPQHPKRLPGCTCGALAMHSS